MDSQPKAAALLSAEQQAWLADFHGRMGRPPRLLHIGNIGNNAYNNAKMLRRAGIECDVLCYDYYHVMACPEWEDADWEGRLASNLYAEWQGIDCGGFTRPTWFVQGPLVSCLRYLLARYSGSPRREQCSRWLLSWDRRMACLEHRRTDPESLPATFLQRILASTWRRGRQYLRPATLGKVWNRLRPLLLGRSGTILERKIAAEPRFAELQRLYRDLFAERPDQLEPDDVARFIDVIPLFRRVQKQYDLVVGYSTDGLFPLFAGTRPYIAYEHGTIRSIPFEGDGQARLCSLTYRLAQRTFITNCDNIHAAQRLGLTDYQFVPHPINEDHLPSLDAHQLRRQLREQLRADFLVFHPARQHWDAQRHPSWEKGNDLFIRGFARFVKECRPAAGAVFVEWGRNVAESRQLLAELGVADRVAWVPLQANQRMQSYIQACDLLADQFYLGAFGGILPKALRLGRPAMLYLDEQIHRWCFSEMPPILNVKTPDDVFRQLSRLTTEPAYRDALCTAGPRWYQAYHSNRVTTTAFVDALRDLLPTELSRPARAA